MKKIYTLFAAAAVAMSAVAAPVAMPASQSFLGKSPKTLLNTEHLQMKSERMQTPESPRYAISSVNDIAGLYDCVAYSYANEGSYIATHEITVVNDNTVKFNGLLYTDVVFDGTVDLASGTISCAPAVIITLQGYDFYLLNGTWSADGQDITVDPTSPVVFNVNADGTISQKDNAPICLSTLDGQSVVDIFEQVSYSPSSKNAKFEFKEYQVNSAGTNFTEETLDYTLWCNAELDGSSVNISDFIYNDALVIDFDLSAGTATIEPQYSFTTQGYDVYVSDMSGSSLSPIQGTSSGNVISWTGDWGYVCDGGVVGLFNGGTFTFNFNLDGSGVSDLTVEDENAPVEYFNLQGVRVENPSNGLYIRRQGNVSTKVLVK